MIRRVQFAALLLALGLMLALALTGLAQTETPTAEPVVEEEPTATPEDATPTVTVTLEISPTSTVTATSVATATAEAESVTSLPIISAVTATEAITAELAEEPVTVTATLAEMPLGPEAPLELTVYANRGLVKELRTLELEEGLNEVRLVGVASAIDPTSAILRAVEDPEAVTVLEQFFVYDLASTQTLLSQYLQQQIGVRTESGAVYTGTLLSAQNDIILATEEGLRVVRVDTIQEFTLPPLEDEPVREPTLVWLLSADAAGPQPVRVTYLTNNMSWRADYVVVLAPQMGDSSLSGWITVNNNSGATYEDAQLKLVAGDVNQVQQPQFAMKEEAVRAAAPAVEERSFSEYHLYEVQRPVTVPDGQTKQIEFLASSEITPTRVYIYDAAPQVTPRPGTANVEPRFGEGADTTVQVRLEMTNSVASGLGVPLPAGVVRVYQADVDGSTLLIGEDRIDHTATGEEIALDLGAAFDVVGERTQLNFRQLGERSLEETYQITLRNRKDEDIVVRVIERLFRAEDAEIIEASQEYTLLDANTAQFLLPVEAMAQSTLTYTVEYNW